MESEGHLYSMVIQRHKNIRSSMQFKKEERTDGMGSIYRGDCPADVFGLGAEKERKVGPGKNNR